MKEMKSNGKGWVDRGNNKMDASRVLPGPVILLDHKKDPYTNAEVAEIIRQGRDNPRRLSMKEAKLAAKNRAAANADLRAMESWATSEL